MKENKEIELTLQLSNMDWEIIENWLNTKAKFTNTIKITDTYFDSTTAPFSFLKGNYYKIIRSRSIESGYEISFKDWQENKDFNYLSQCEEISIKVNSIKSANLLLYRLGMNYHLSLKKTRHVYIFNNYEISIDVIEELGQYLEIEIIDTTLSKIEDVLVLIKDMGITNYHIVDKSPLEELINRC